MLELGRAPTEFTQSSLKLWGSWGGIDKLFDDFLDRGLDLKLVIRTGRLYSREKFEAQAKERFPLMAGRDRIRFETSLAVDEYWSKCSPLHSAPTIQRIDKLIRFLTRLHQGHEGFLVL